MWVTMTEAAQRLSITRQAVHARIKRGALQSRRVGRQLQVRLEAQIDISTDNCLRREALACATAFAAAHQLPLREGFERWSAAEACRPSARSLWRWKDTFAEAPAWEERFRELYLRPGAPSVAWCYRRLKEEASQSAKLPTLRTLQRYAAQIPEVERVWHHKGPKAAEALMPYTARDRTTVAVNEVWNTDHMQVDIWVKAPDGSVVCPWLTAVSDWRSATVVGWILQPDAPDRHTILSVYRQAISAHGAPKLLVSDNGRDFCSRDIVGGLKRFRGRRDQWEQEAPGALKLLGIEFSATLPFNGRSKHIERIFKTLQEEFRAVPGYRGNSPANRPEDAERRRKSGDVMTLAWLQSAFSGWLASYHARPSEGQGFEGRSPNDVLAEWVDAGGRKRVVPEAKLAMALMSQAERTVRAGGYIRIHKRLYEARCLVWLQRRQVTVRWDPADLSAIHVWNGQKYIGMAQPQTQYGLLDGDGPAVAAAARKSIKDEIQARAPKRRAKNEMAADTLANGLEKQPTATVLEIQPTEIATSDAKHFQAEQRHSEAPSLPPSYVTELDEVRSRAEQRKQERKERDEFIRQENKRIKEILRSRGQYHG